MDDSFYILEGINQDLWSIFDLFLCMKHELIEGELLNFYVNIFNLIPLVLKIFMGILRYIIFC